MTPAPPEWRVESGLVDYDAALAAMEARAEAIRDGGAPELIWLLEHPPVYTAGTSAKEGDLVDPLRFPVRRAGRGGQFTYHGPGQRVGYVMLDLAARGKDIRRFVDALELWVIDTLAQLGVNSRQAAGRVGVWVDTPSGEAKIAALGVRVRRWVTFHGFAINVAPDLSHYAGIVPCGLPDYPVTSLGALGNPATVADVDAALRDSFDAFAARLGGGR
ncbi:MAG: lipoyl(octanoyl) transferase LipB [Bradyrhizobium sp.]|uniref:lipoyl(octanoyl) transferase LipB n=1 Tax=Bradyrhizobium sp. TaxID=376 RepID=UPI0025BE7FA7|nr:lipoyl(octanoyl) transferase LipB [Bradyrhizobium sp.]MCA3579283.1 lipoyl(octanoyl) transferase LipB [Bradyrhizobium sp.]